MNILKGLLLTIGIFVLAFALTALPVFFEAIGAVILLGIIFIVLVVVFSFKWFKNWKEYDNQCLNILMQITFAKRKNTYL